TGLSYKDRKNLVKRMTQCGHSMPEGWDQPNFRYWVVDYPSKAQNLPELKERLEQQQKDKTPKDMRDSAPRPVVPVKSGGQIAAEANLMVLTKDEKDRSNATILRITDRQGKDIPSPIDIQKAESKYPQWSLQFGVDSKRPDAWLPEDLAQYMQENGRAASICCLNTGVERSTPNSLWRRPLPRPSPPRPLTSRLPLSNSRRPAPAAGVIGSN